jgi:thiol:disulfide interchange protein
MTRWILVGLLVVMAFVTVFKRSTPWVGQDFAAAVAESAKDRKPVVAVVGADWCTYCHKFQDETLPDKRVKEALAKYRVVLVDGDTAEGKGMMSRYGVQALPTILFLDPDGVIVERLTGFVEPDQFVQAIEIIGRQM